MNSSAFHRFTLMALSVILLFPLRGFSEGGHDHGGGEAFQKTIWSEKTELFMEFDPPIKGKPGGFLLHLTDLAAFKPFSSGTVTLSLIPATGDAVKTSMNAPARPGIFKTMVVPLSAGPHHFKLEIVSPTLNDTIEWSGLPVAETAGSVKHEESEHQSPSGEAAISFLKEQQWTVEFDVKAATARELATRLTVTGEFTPVSNAESVITSPVAGTISHSRAVPYLGQHVKAGEPLALIEPPLQQEGGIDELSVKLAEAKSRVLLAQKEVDRARRLVEAKAAPRKRLEEAEILLDTAKSALAPLAKAMRRIKPGVSENRVTITAPIGGSVVEVLAANGASVQAGQPIMRVIDIEKLWLKANVPIAQANNLSSLSHASFQVPGMAKEFQISRLVVVTDVMDSKTRTVPVIFEVNNPEHEIKVGLFVNVILSNGTATETVAVPDSAIFEDEGKFFVFLQPSGEIFERREVIVGMKDRGYVQILKGVQAGEHVVVKGGYYVKLASQASKTPQGHGHEH